MISVNKSKTVKYLRLLYPFWVLIGMFGIMYVPSTLINLASPITTANNISDHDMLFRLGIIARLIAQLFYIIIPLLLYRLFKDVDKFAATLMIVFAFVSIPITLYIEAHYLSILDFLDKPNQVVESIELYKKALLIASVFWGLWLLPLGQLVIKSNAFPKLIGYFLYLAGIGYLLSAFTSILFPDSDLLITIFEYMTIGEVIFILWLVVMGVKYKADNVKSYG